MRDCSVRVVAVGACIVGEHKDTAATLSKYLWREREDEVR